MKKSKAIFVLLALIVTFLLLVFSFALAEGSILFMLLAVVLITATMGYGFTLKKKYRENGWL
ncbi:DUF5325 family protein [Mammaliicoccus stepanovicii]|uniref:Uncharacterized protein n=1 Tax=Mammaliicoccus stepanovicii TaxID=643214 RepID=A0A239ZMM1_9STAP|nr:DUF5325 family protein [Mammaliicoccus stepanovicii]PNZ79198.1 hypothetical protein CD111_00660 [Mammaliicoccus stepanovicii]GGI41467.1 membrane protein [Mammaliicoccus stepanovicii]SNV72482.1 Uncharacterised protein [Mammaliicoccus stepanovicii]